ncbi:MAG: efflux RND transporter periplasmic adaptor subunit [Acidobacteria bacterium]|jgi:HlyD family secretion protein|nr:efflux RND transporter periplasmic adaptor subunit [Acidobacteriota bacterium]
MAVSRKGKIIIGITAVVLLTIVIIASIFATRKDTPEVTVVKVETRPELRSTVTSSGEIRPIQFINLTSEVQGRIEEIYVKEGDKVTAGTPLVKLDPTQLQSSTDAQLASLQAAQSESQVTQSQITAAQNQLSQAQQGLNATQAQVDTALQQVASARQQVVAAQTDVDKAQVDLNTANRELKRTAELVEAGVESRSNFDAAKDRVATAQVALRNAQARLKSQNLGVNEAQARVNEARARAKQQEVAVKDARRGVETADLSANASVSRAEQQAAVLRGSKSQRDKTLQVAPINGVIADIPSKVGTFAVANLTSTPLLTIADMSAINVEVKVDETEIDKVEVGQPVKVKVDAFGEKELTGEVTQKTPLAVGKSQTTGGLSTNINVQEAKEFRVVIELKDMNDEIRDSLRPGMSATAVITTETAENVIAVPLQAVIEKKPDASPSPSIEGDVPPAPSEKPKTIKGVYVLDGNKAKFVEVETGITGESDIQITAGLSEGQEVITGPSRVLNTLKEGTVVKRQVKKEGGDTPKT